MINSMVQFDPIKHKYYNEAGIEYISVTTLIGKYESPKDRLEMARTFLRNRPHLKMTIQEVVDMWDKKLKHAGERGTKYHDEQERKELKDSNVVNKSNQHSYLFDIDISNLEDGVYPELRIFNHECGIAGHADKVTVKGRDVWIGDHKTNKKGIQKTSYRDIRMNSPLNFLPDCNYYHYTLQLSLYGWMLEQFGYTVKGMQLEVKRFMDDEEIPAEYRIPWLSEKEQRKVQVIPLTYQKDWIELMLNDYCKFTA